MICPMTTPEEWSKLYGIKIEDKTCLGCKEVFACNIPIAIKGYRGFIIPEHSCAPKYRCSKWVPIGKEELEFWGSIF